MMGIAISRKFSGSRRGRFPKSTTAVMIAIHKECSPASSLPKILKFLDIKYPPANGPPRTVAATILFWVWSPTLGSDSSFWNALRRKGPNSNCKCDQRSAELKSFDFLPMDDKVNRWVPYAAFPCRRGLYLSGDPVESWPNRVQTPCWFLYQKGYTTVSSNHPEGEPFCLLSLPRC